MKQRKTATKVAIANNTNGSENYEVLAQKFIQGNVLTEHDLVEIKGTKITVPKGMSMLKASEQLQKLHKQLEARKSFSSIFKCLPFDGIIAFERVLKNIFGSVQWNDIYGSHKMKFGSKAITFTWGTADLQYAKGEISIDPNFRNNTIEISAYCAAKYENAMNELFTLIEKDIFNNSIYRNNAVMIDMEYMENGKTYNFMQHSPQFFEVANTENLILPVGQMALLEQSAYVRIGNRELCKKHNINIKHGILLAGDYGTGKTLAARNIAKKCVGNGYTFFLLKNCMNLSHAFNIAKLYQPAVIFAEDIDQMLQGKRNAGINDLLNTIDGAQTKDSEIITVLTTNDLQSIEPAMLRAGRIDTLIAFTPFDSETSIRFLKQKMESKKHKVKFDALYEYVDKLQPAFLIEAIQKAQLIALSTGDNVIHTEHLIAAVEGIREHQKVLDQNRKNSEKEKMMYESVKELNKHMNLS